MKRVIVEDKDGYKKAYWVKDNAIDSQGQVDLEFAIPEIMVDVTRLNWDDIKVRLSNILLEEGFTTWQDVQKRPEVFAGAVASVVRNDLVNLYKLTDMEVKQHGQQHITGKNG